MRGWLVSLTIVAGAAAAAAQGPRDPIALVNARILDGRTRLSFEGTTGYLRTLLAALDIPAASQTLVYSETSRQRDLISPATPRAIYFNDTAAVASVHGGDALEVIASEPERGLVFYTLEQKERSTPQLVQGRDCMQCHLLPETGGAGGLLMMSVLPLSDSRYEYARGWSVDDRTPVADRWGGWYVTGTRVPSMHLGNVPVRHVPQSYLRASAAPRLGSVEGRIDRAAYLTPHSDVVALLVLGHQVQVTNLIMRLQWALRTPSSVARPGTAAAPVDDAVRALVDALLFTGEAPLPGPVIGSSGFAGQFAAQGPRDRRGRSLRDLDLQTRLLRYRCSYLIYSAAFDGIAGDARALVYRRLWDVLSGAETDARYRDLSIETRRAIVDILRETKNDIPAYYR